VISLRWAILPTRILSLKIGAPAVLSSWFVLVAILAALDFRNNFIPHSGQLIFHAADSMVEVLELLIGLSALLYMWLNGRMFSNELKKVNTKPCAASDCNSAALK
jgi:hypothetical protein